MGNNVNWIKGRHNVTFGGQLERARFDFWALASGGAGFTADDTNYAHASFLLGKLRSWGQGSPAVNPQRVTHMSLFFHDDFKVNRRFTLNFGLRWEPWRPLHDFYNRSYQFRIKNYEAGVRSQVYPTAPIGMVFPGDPGVPTDGVTGDCNNFAPRIGFAYDVFGDGKTSIRGGAGQFYDARATFQNEYASTPPFSFQFSRGDLDVLNIPFSDPYRGIVDPFPRPIVPAKDYQFPTPLSFSMIADPDKKHITAATYNWNLTIERQLASDTLVRVAYAGSRSNHMAENLFINPAVYIPGSTLSIDRRRLFQGYGGIRMGSPGLNAIYHSLQLTFEKRLSKGLTILSNYTYSKNLDTTPPQFGVPGYGTWPSTLPWYFEGRHQFDYGRVSFDRQQRLVTSFVYRLPRLDGTSRLVRRVVGGWDLTGIWTMQTGGPLTVLAGTERSQTGIGNDRANVVGSPLGPGACGSVAPCVDYLNRSGFQVPAIGTFGNIGKGAINSGPGQFNLDFGLFKNIAITEAIRVQLRGEFFNATNRANFNDPDVSMASGNFGRIRSAADPRIVQMAVKVIF